jgi:hypothetical protein
MQVSVGAITFESQPALGLAVLGAPGTCLTLVLMPPNSGETFEPVRRELGALQPCAAALAGT